MSTSTPPPYFPQNPLSQQSKSERRKFFLKILGCLGLLLLLIVIAIVALVTRLL
ncbi:MAG: hypothetical protein ABR577_18775 [Pyrinomonadaceae bacterium]